MDKTLLDLIKFRRSIYQISNKSPISNEEIINIINEAVKHSPTAFNSQSSRVVILFGTHHEKLWDITTETLRKIVPAEAFGSTEQKMKLFKNGYGTILFFEDENIIKKLQEDYSLYKDNFPIWSEQSQGMLQFIIWTALSNNGLGASLQHYNPLIDEEVKTTWNIKPHWKLVAQMPFGKPISDALPKEFLPLDERVKIFE